MTGTDWKQVGHAVIRRRTALGIKTATELAERADLTPRVIGDLENGRRSNYTTGTKAQIEAALQWPPGSIDVILAGGDPTPMLGLHRGMDAVPTTKPASGRMWSPEDGVRDFWSSNARSDLPEFRPLSPETVHRLLITAQTARAALAAAVDNSGQGRESFKDLGSATEAVASTADIAAIESFGGAYEFSRSVPALRAYMAAQTQQRDRESGQFTVFDESPLVSLDDHYREMHRRVDSTDRDVLHDQALKMLGTDPDPNDSVQPEVPDGLYVQYLAERHVPQGQGGLSSARSLTEDDYRAAMKRYRREMAEIRVFGGVRTAPELDAERQHALPSGQTAQSNASTEAEAEEVLAAEEIRDITVGFTGSDDALEDEEDGAGFRDGPGSDGDEEDDLPDVGPKVS